MANQKQGNCPNCGPSLAVKNGGPGIGELFGMGMLAAITCGIGLIAVIPWAVFRGYQSGQYHCQRCGAKV